MTPRSQRGLMTRPSLKEIWDWRQRVDAKIRFLLETRYDDPELLALIRLGIEHEYQHQELLLMDIKHHFFCNPTYPAYHKIDGATVEPNAPDLEYLRAEPGLTEMGSATIPTQDLLENFSDPYMFAYDNETPRHRAYLADFALANRPVLVREYLQFMEDGGYENVALWLADGWQWRQDHQIDKPLYWQKLDGRWCEFTLVGRKDLAENRPVCHLSYYEACAYAQWAGQRLPTEYELEFFLRLEEQNAGPRTGFMEDNCFEPTATSGFAGDIWEWTRSAYAPYPGFKPLCGSIGEYNGKFMVNQQVLRGGSCVTPTNHFRSSYRNFYYPHERWAFAGVRLARDL